MLIYGIIAAVFGGIFIALQGSINGMIGSKVGIFTTVIIPVIIQIIILCTMLLFNRRLWINILKLKDIEFGLGFLIISALLGLAIMSFLTFSIMKTDPLIVFAIVVFSQLFTAMIVEHFGFFEAAQKSISSYRVLGLIAILVGIGLFYK
ncbi:DMT family transporter [Paramaledivibacter caminithermalis]|jgi:transporter family-2 protein|uniref:Putative inner membrane exporter, YdcZ n=1 Tax=Paramaledivibacter caminithermalis (strain DSM 15212 / CIP 107654 / DViRD3) TaxID=1121301 RepID=A0A1M6QDG5_PARC5|nr:DMT family transporter [Paramaledivibacter caminithermalis]SHK18160.1 Putative inner membrane exporter, YdcZ [Paramaledivibacter caminithermalis DSM 15212]